MRVLLTNAKPELTRSLSRHSGVEVVVLQPGAANETNRGQLAPGVEVWPYGSGSRLSPTAAWQVRRAILATRPDIVHAFYGRALCHTLLAVSGMRNRPRIVTFRGITAELSPRNLSDWISYRHRHVVAHTCESEAVRQALVRSGVRPDRCWVIYNTMLFPPSRRPGRTGLRPLDVPPDAFVVGTVANVRHIKGIDVLLQAAIRCADLADVYWVLFGRVEDRLVRQLATDERIASRVRLAGFQPNASELISGADLFVMPSRAEALCQALLEAMHQGVCPVVSDAGGMKEVVRHGQDGLVVPRENAAALAGAIRSLYENRQRLEQFAASARRRVAEAFTAERMAERTLAVYRHLLSGGDVGETVLPAA